MVQDKMDQQLASVGSWCKKELSSVLQFPVEDDLVRYTAGPLSVQPSWLLSSSSLPQLPAVNGDHFRRGGVSREFTGEGGL